MRPSPHRQRNSQSSLRFKWECWTEDGGSTLSSRKNPSKASTSTCLPSSLICVTGEPCLNCGGTVSTLKNVMDHMTCFPSRGFSCVWRSGCYDNLLFYFLSFFPSLYVNGVCVQGIRGRCSPAAEGDLRQTRGALWTASVVKEFLNYRLCLSHGSSLNAGSGGTCHRAQGCTVLLWNALPSISVSCLTFLKHSFLPRPLTSWDFLV